jgi:hypothetical protein
MTARLFEPFATFMFEIVGTVVVVDSAGKRSPLAGVRFYSGEVKDGHFVGEPIKGGVTDKAGVFRELASAMVPLEKVCTDLKARTAHFLLRAKGCDDLMIEATPEWKPHEIEMHCSGRRHGNKAR